MNPRFIQEKNELEKEASITPGKLSDKYIVNKKQHNDDFEVLDSRTKSVILKGKASRHGMFTIVGDKLFHCALPEEDLSGRNLLDIPSFFNTVKIWDLKNKTQIFEQNIQLGHHPRTAAVGHKNRVPISNKLGIYLWGAIDGENIYLVKLNKVRTIQTIQVYNINSGKLIKQIAANGTYISGAFYNGKLITSHTNQNNLTKLEVWNSSTPNLELISSINTPVGAYLSGLVDNKVIFLKDLSNSVATTYIWNIEKFDAPPTVFDGRYVQSLSHVNVFGEVFKNVAIFITNHQPNESATLQIFDMDSLEQLPVPQDFPLYPTGGSCEFYQVPEWGNSFIVSIGETNNRKCQIKIWDMQFLKCIKTFSYPDMVFWWDHPSTQISKGQFVFTKIIDPGRYLVPAKLQCYLLKCNAPELLQQAQAEPVFSIPQPQLAAPPLPQIKPAPPSLSQGNNPTPPSVPSVAYNQRHYANSIYSSPAVKPAAPPVPRAKPVPAPMPQANLAQPPAPTVWYVDCLGGISPQFRSTPQVNKPISPSVPQPPYNPPFYNQVPSLSSVPQVNNSVPHSASKIKPIFSYEQISLVDKSFTPARESLPVTPVPRLQFSIPQDLLIPSDKFKYNDNGYLGHGSFGTAYKGTWQGITVAIKKLTCQEMSEKTQQEFEHEITMMARFRHPNVIGLYGICVEPDEKAILMEHMPRKSLDKNFSRLKQQGWTVRLKIALDISRGLWHLHDKDILHRDLKSPNVLLDDKDAAKLCDFGLSQLKIETQTYQSKLASKEYLISPCWMAPELFEKKAHSKKSDIYALGIVFWELAACKFPYQGKDIEAIKKHVTQKQRETIPGDTPPSFAKLIAKCWAQRAEQRPTIEEVVKELDENPHQANLKFVA